jgi:tetratricopeptide (TPR) repeat protein
VAWYNLSILESRFYRYDRSLDATNASLNAQNRASGRLARGELYLRQLALEQAQRDYEAAYETDTSPLAKLNLAQIYQISGRLEEARLYAEDCLKASDNSWMLHYGIDPDRYKRDIHEILYKTYEGLAGTESFMPWGKADEKIRSLLRSISYRFKTAVHRRLFQKYSLAAADAYGANTNGANTNGANTNGANTNGANTNGANTNGTDGGGGSHLDSFIQYYNAFKDYPRRSLAYLNRARDFESSLIPEAEPSYDLEEGLLLRDPKPLERSLAGLDPFWEGELISQCYREFARMGRKTAAEELFTLNRGALRQACISLPVEITISMTGDTQAAGFKKARIQMRKALAKAGFKPANTARFRLDITLFGSTASGYTASCDLTDTEGRTLSYSIPLRSLSGADIAGFARALGNVIFKVE